MMAMPSSRSSQDLGLVSTLLPLTFAMSTEVGAEFLFDPSKVEPYGQLEVLDLDPPMGGVIPGAPGESRTAGEQDGHEDGGDDDREGDDRRRECGDLRRPHSQGGVCVHRPKLD